MDLEIRLAVAVDVALDNGLFIYGDDVVVLEVAQLARLMVKMLEANKFESLIAGLV